MLTPPVAYPILPGGGGSPADYPMAAILHKQAVTYARSVNDLLMEDHGWAMKCWDAEEAIQLGFALFDAFEEVDSKWRASVKRAKADHAEALLTVGKLLREVSRIMQDIRPRTLDFIQRVEAQGYNVDGADRFRNAVHIPFDERRLDIAIEAGEIAAFVGATAPANSPDISDDSDDDL